MNPQQLISLLPKILSKGKVPLLVGDPGIGKSDLAEQVTTNMGRELIDMRLNLYDPTDLRGYPVMRKPKTGAESMHFITPSMLPRSGTGVILLDEFFATPPLTQNTAYQFILDRRLGEYELPEGWDIMAAGNHAHNGGTFYAPPPALMNRFVRLEVETSHPQWDVWAAQNGVSWMTRSFLSFRPGLLHDISAYKGTLAWPSPRSWVSADSLIDDSMTTTEMFAVLKGTVGEGAATEYLAYVKNAAELPTIDELLRSPDTASIPSSPGAKHAVTELLVDHSDASHFETVMTYIKRLPTEYQTAFVHKIAEVKAELTGTPGFITWAMTNKQMLGMS